MDAPLLADVSKHPVISIFPSSPASKNNYSIKISLSFLAENLPSHMPPRLQSARGSCGGKSRNVQLGQ
jgi:hypothetical protein